MATKIALSTNWCNRRLESGEAIVDEALSLGFEALELGFHTTHAQAKGFKARLDEMPVGSVHAFCPVPISAPQGYPELYSLASFSADARALARVHITNNARFAAEMGADVVVLHAGRVMFSTLFRVLDSQVLSAILQKCGKDACAKKYVHAFARAKAVRTDRGAKMMTLFKRELEQLIPVLESCGVVLALENLPYYEGFPNEDEMCALLDEFAGAPIKAWFDTGHDRVRAMHGWIVKPTSLDVRSDAFAGMHVNDVVDFYDDHLPPGRGKVDFAALKPLADTLRHVVVEPAASVSREDLAEGLARLREVWL